MSSTRYFLGANSRHGFYSYYHEFCDPANGNFLWVIKGGPGCGKSSFMRRIGDAAERAGLAVEYVLCSGDPDSLDGIYLPELKTGYVDGTAPHVIEPNYPAAGGAYLNLGQFYDTLALRERLADIASLCARCQTLYRSAYEALAAIKYRKPRGSRAALSGRHVFDAAISCQGILRLENPRRRTEVVSTLAPFENSRATLTLYMNPFDPESISGVVVDGEPVIYRLTGTLPDCGGIIRLLAAAKQLHDEMEAIYNPHVNFDGVYSLCDAHIRELF